MRGIDVSYYQGAVDWPRMAAEGIRFAMVKASQGRLLSDPAVGPFPDPRFHENMKGAKAAGIPVGVYHYLTARNEAEASAEAAYFLSLIAPVKRDIALWAVCDAEEDRFLPAEREALAAVIRAFLTPVAAAGFRPMLYSNPNYLTYRLPPMEYDLWLAYWGVSEAQALAYRPKIWQYGIESVGGIGQVDVNRGYFSLPANESGKEETDGEEREDDVLEVDPLPSHSLLVHGRRIRRDTGSGFVPEGGQLRPSLGPSVHRSPHERGDRVVHDQKRIGK